MALEIVTAETSWLESDSSVSWITLDEVKNHLNIADSDDDALIQTYISAALSFTASCVSRDLNNHYEYLTYKVDNRYLKEVLYTFDGLSVTSADTQVKKHEELNEGLTDFSNQDDVTFIYMKQDGNIDVLYINPSLTDKKYVTIKNHVEWNVDNFQHIKGVMFSLVAEYYRNREITLRNQSLSRVMNDVLNTLRKQ